MRPWPCSRHKRFKCCYKEKISRDDPENVKLYTLFKTEDPENDTMTVGMSLYRKYTSFSQKRGRLSWNTENTITTKVTT